MRAGKSVPSGRIGEYVSATGLVMAELLWPARCAICESAGSLLCDRCRMHLPYIDQWRACPRCGAPFGATQCTECNSFALERLGLPSLPFEACVSALLFDDASARIVRRYKDSGERGLAAHIAFAIACAIPPAWIADEGVVSCIPATKKARKRRGFDHCESIGRECSGFLGLPFEMLLSVGRAKDQRSLGRQGRLANARDRFEALPSCEGKNVILIDDVLTTGATLLAASEALVRAGAASVRCASFARVY